MQQTRMFGIDLDLVSNAPNPKRFGKIWRYKQQSSLLELGRTRKRFYNLILNSLCLDLDLVQMPLFSDSTPPLVQ
jgi:hypothetical protein